MSNITMIQKPKEDVCSHKFSFLLDNWIRRWIQNPKKIVGEYIHPGDTVMDLGCGPGFFSIDMAKLVGENGKVIAVDLQEKMLAYVRKKAAKHGVSQRMVFHLCESDAVDINQTVDFIFAFYMVHETPDSKALLREIQGMLKPKGKLLVVEPNMHVSQKSFDHMLRQAKEVGLAVIDCPKGKGGRSVLFQR